MAIKVIIEFRAKSGRRDELHSTLEALVEDQGSGLDGYLGSNRYAVVDDADLLVEIAEWTTVEARVKHLEEARATGAFATVFELLTGPPRATVLRDLPSTAAKSSATRVVTGQACAHA